MAHLRPDALGSFKHLGSAASGYKPRSVAKVITLHSKKLFVFGEDFDAGAVILLNGDQQATLNDPRNPQTVLIGKKAGKKIQRGDKIQVLNSTGALSQEFIFVPQ